jgi:colanic acid biosynthesis glycosyl transferase WcaI
MRILIINQFFWPDVAPTGQYLCDLVRHLDAKGHDITVVCSKGSYASTEEDVEDPPPAKIIQVPGMPYKRGALARLFSYAAFFSGALWHELRVPRPDMVITMTTPPMLAVAGTIMKAFRGTRHFIWEMDVYPDLLVTLGALPEHGLVTRILSWIQNYARRHSDGIIALGPCMRTRLLAGGTPEHLVHVAENWADGRSISPGPNRRSGPLKVFYSGNLGVAHDVNTIADAMRHLRNDSRFLFTFADGGVGRSQLEQICANEDIQNVRFLPYARREQMTEHLAQADIGLVTELATCTGTVVPSKTYGLMAAGRPILFVGPKEATPGLLIERFRCGWQIDPGDVQRFTGLLEWLAVRRDEAWARGDRARAAFDRHYDLPQGVSRVAAALGLGEPIEASVWETTVEAGDRLEVTPAEPRAVAAGGGD